MKIELELTQGELSSLKHALLVMGSRLTLRGVDDDATQDERAGARIMRADLAAIEAQL